MSTDHLARLRAMSTDHGETWDLSATDRAALAWAVERLAESALVASGEPYLIRCVDMEGGYHRGSLALWWRPNRAGYTVYLDEAGRYTREEAEAQDRERIIDEAWPLSKALALAGRTVSNEAADKVRVLVTRGRTE